MTRSLTQHLVTLLDRPIDELTKQFARLHLLDWIGYSALGATSAAGSALLQYGARQPSGPCVALGADFRDAASAAFVNGGLGNIYELDDVHKTSIMHAGDVVIPAALAAAQRANADGEKLLEAIVKGYEVSIRIGIAASSTGYSPWYNSSTCGVFGAASAVAVILGLEPKTHIDALGQAGMQAAGLWQCRLEPSYSKQFACARAAQSGMIAADIAQVGFPAPPHILEGELGFFKTYYPNARPAAVIADKGGHWKINETSFKPWPACRHTHPVIEAGIKLRELGLHEDIANISVTTYQAAIEFCDQPNPKTEHEAQFSLQHCLAVALINGEAELADFSQTAIAKPDFAALRDKINLRADKAFTKAFPAQYGADINVTFADNRTENIRIETAKGDPENPLSEDEISAKYHNCLLLAGVRKQHGENLEKSVRALKDDTNMPAFSKAFSAISTDIQNHIHKKI